ncbi:hypothetical protein [Okeania sp. KiyG1]|uniref:hypothetical protein n=1 Tax=Okeania sp. KiyG1 TaxID=2720165 RepID=UPI001920E1B5|nr:hypothetical protein [Okeania sp. KiyG1]
MTSAVSQEINLLADEKESLNFSGANLMLIHSSRKPLYSYQLSVNSYQLSVNSY